MKPNKTLAQQIVERESAKIAQNPPPIPPGLKDTPKIVLERAIVAHLDKFIQDALTKNIFEGEPITFEHEGVLKEIREITETLRGDYEKKWKDLRK